MPALNIVEREWRVQRRTALEAKNTEGGKGALIIVGRRDQDKFFSNGVCYIPAASLAFILISRSPRS